MSTNIVVTPYKPVHLCCWTARKVAPASKYSDGRTTAAPCATALQTPAEGLAIQDRHGEASARTHDQTEGMKKRNRDIDSVSFAYSHLIADVPCAVKHAMMRQRRSFRESGTARCELQVENIRVSDHFL